MENASDILKTSLNCHVILIFYFQVRMEDKANLILLFFAMVIAVANPQKVPPGVNPNAYQPPPPQQQVSFNCQ